VRFIFKSRNNATKSARGRANQSWAGAPFIDTQLQLGAKQEEAVSTAFLQRQTVETVLRPHRCIRRGWCEWELSKFMIQNA